MMSHVLCHNRSADGVESKSWLAILFSFQRLLLFTSFYLSFSIYSHILTRVCAVAMAMGLVKNKA